MIDTVIDADKRVADRLDDLAEFAVQNGGRWCFDGWPKSVIEQYLAFHAHQGNLAYVMDGGTIVSLGVAWRQDDDGKFEFDWKMNDELGNTIFIAEVISVLPGGLSHLLGRLVRRWPDYRSTRIAARRKGRIRQIPLPYMGRILQMEARHGY